MSSTQSVSPRRVALLLVVLFFPLYLLNLWMVELRRDEALLGSVAREMAASRDFLFHHVPGRSRGDLPAVPGACGAVQRVGGAEYVQHAVAGGIWPCWRRRWSARPLRAGVGEREPAWWPAGWCCRLWRVFARCQRAQSETLLMFWLTCGWLSWYVYGQERKQWGLAWGQRDAVRLPRSERGGGSGRGLFLSSVSLSQTAGPGAAASSATVPPGGGGRLRRHGSGLAPCGTRAAVHHAVERRAHTPMTRVGGCLWNRLVFPVKVALYLMPWLAFAWVPFCVAFRSVEQRPVLFHYLRTVCTSLFVLLWLTPWSSPLLLLPVLPALSIMTGLPLRDSDSSPWSGAGAVPGGHGMVRGGWFLAGLADCAAASGRRGGVRGASHRHGGRERPGAGVRLRVGGLRGTWRTGSSTILGTFPACRACRASGGRGGSSPVGGVGAATRGDTWGSCWPANWTPSSCMAGTVPPAAGRNVRRCPHRVCCRLPRRPRSRMETRRTRRGSPGRAWFFRACRRTFRWCSSSVPPTRRDSRRSSAPR